MKRYKENDSTLLMTMDLSELRKTNKFKKHIKPLKYNGIFLAISLLLSGPSNATNMPVNPSNIDPVSLNQIIGTDGDDTLYGTTGDDYIDGKKGNDKLYGRAGNDSLIAGPGTNFLQGGTGNDTYIVHRGDGQITIYDYGNSNEQDKVIFEGLNSTDIVSVELPDNDTLVVNFNSGDQVTFQDRRSIYNQIVNYTFADGEVFTTNDLLAYKTITLTNPGTYNLGEGNDHVIGTLDNDIIGGSGGDDKLEGLSGNDELWGDNGNDTLLGGLGDDILRGGNGNDRLEAGEGNDKLYGGDGNDSLIAGPGTNFLQGGTGNDTYIVHRGDGQITIYDYGNSNEQDKVIFEGLNSTDIVSVELPDNDTLVVNFNSGDQVTFQDRRSIYNQIVNYTFADGEIFTTNDLLAYKTITLTNPGTYNLGEGNDHVIGTLDNDIIGGSGGDDKLEGLSGNDELWGDNGNDTLLGGLGDDILRGGNGNDRLEAGEGNDKLYGGDGNDSLIAGPGTNFLQGGTGNDTYIVHRGDGQITIYDYGNSNEQDKVIFEGLNSTDIVSVELPDNDTLVVNFNSGDQVTFQDRRSSYNQIVNYTFADGVVLTTSELLSYEALSISLKPTNRYTNQIPSWAWVKKDAVKTYEINIQNAAGNSVHTAVLGDIDQFSYLIDLQDGQSYRARIRGSSDNGETWGPWSSFSSYITLDLIAPTVKLNSFVRVNSNTSLLNFIASDNLSGIEKLHLQVSANPSFTTLLLDTDISITKNSYQIDDISNVSGLYARLSAVDSVGNVSDYSETVSISIAPPTFIYPVAKTVVKEGTIKVLGNAISNGKAQLYLNGAMVGEPISVGDDGYFSTDINLASEGNYQLTAVLSNDFGASEQSAPVSFSFALPIPKAIITTPTSNQEILAPMDIQVGAADELGIEKVDIYIDDQLFTTLTEQPYQTHWPLTVEDNGTHTLTAKVTNISGKVATVTHSVKVKIGPPAPPPTVYTGKITSVTPTISYGLQPITIVGQAIYRVDNAIVANAPIKLVLTVNGFERKISTVTDENGSFSYTFIPQESDSGIYQVAITHPDESTATPQASFSINRIAFNLQGFNLKAPRNIKTPITVNATASTGAKNLRWVLAADNQPDGNLPKGIQIASDAIDIGVGESKSTVINFIADDTAAEAGTIYLVALADDSGSLVRGKLQVNYQLGQAMPTLYATPSYIQTGLQQGTITTTNINLGNKGLAKAENVQLQLVDQSGNPAPSWVFIATDKTIGSIAVDEQIPVQIVAQPDNTIADGVYRFNIKLSANNNISGSIPVSISVTQSGQGIAQFDVADIYTATLDGAGQPIPGVKGATIKLQNEAVLTQEYSITSNDQGIASLENIPTGIYRYRVSAPNHMDVSGRIVIRPNTTTNEHIFLEYQTINIEFGVTETTIQDIYDINLNATFNTQVPAPVVLVEPLSINLAGLQVGEEKTGQLTITNYGLVQAKNVVLNLPKTDARFKYEFFGEVPSVLLPKEKTVIPYRVTALDPNQAKSIETKTAIQPSLLKARAGDDCTSYSAAYSEVHESDCANGDTSKGNSSGYFYMYKGKCPSTGSGWGSGGMLGGNGGYGAGSGGIISPSPMPITPGCSPEADCASAGTGSGAK